MITLYIRILIDFSNIFVGSIMLIHWSYSVHTSRFLQRVTCVTIPDSRKHNSLKIKVVFFLMILLVTSFQTNVELLSQLNITTDCCFVFLSFILNIFIGHIPFCVGFPLLNTMFVSYCCNWRSFIFMVQRYSILLTSHQKPIHSTLYECKG